MSAAQRSVLRQVAVFAGLSDDELDHVLSVLKARRGGPGEALVRQGDVGASLMIVLSGRLDVVVRSSLGTEDTVGHLGAGEVVGEMAFVDAEERSASVVAREVTTVLEFSRAGMAQLRASVPRVAATIQRNVLESLVRRLRARDEQLAHGSGARLSHAPAARTSGRAVTPEQLAELPAFEKFTRGELELLAHVGTLHAFARGSVLATEGERGDACWMIVRGRVQIARSGARAPLATLGEGSLVGQLALVDHAPRSATVTANEDCLALEVRADSFDALMRASSPVALRFQHQVALAAVRQLRGANAVVPATPSTSADPPGSLRFDDWDDADGPPLELEFDPSQR